MDLDQTQTISDYEEEEEEKVEEDKANTKKKEVSLKKNQLSECALCTICNSTYVIPRSQSPPVWGGGVTHYYGLYGEAPPERGTLFRLQVYKRVGISQV